MCQIPADGPDHDRQQQRARHQHLQQPVCQRFVHRGERAVQLEQEHHDLFKLRVSTLDILLQNPTFSIQSRTFLVQNPNISIQNTNISIQNQHFLPSSRSVCPAGLSHGASNARSIFPCPLDLRWRGAASVVKIHYV